jgi:hypothetical protein
VWRGKKSVQEPEEKARLKKAEDRKAFETFSR